MKSHPTSSAKLGKVRLSVLARFLVRRLPPLVFLAFLLSATAQAADSEYNFRVVSGVLRENDPVSRFVLPLVVEDVIPGAAEGDPSSQYLLAVMHANGLGVVKDLLAATEWHAKAVENQFTYDPFNLGDLTGLRVADAVSNPAPGVFAVKGIRNGQSKNELLATWESLTEVPLAYSSLGRDRGGYPWESCKAGTPHFDIDWFPSDGSDPIVPGLPSASGEELTIGLIPLHFAEISLRDGVVVEASFKLKDSKTIPNFSAPLPQLRLLYDACPKVELCDRYEEVFSKLPDVEEEENGRFPPDEKYEKCG